MECYINILYYINIYKKWWKYILSIALITMFCTAVFSFLTPSKYISTVTVIFSDSSSSGASSIEKFLGISDITMGGSSYGEIISAIIGSKRMAKDINVFLELNKNAKFKYKISTRNIASGLAIDVVGDDAVFTEKVANYAVQNLDKINSELNITPNKPMAKVLDSAGYGIGQSRQISRKTFVAGFGIFLLMSFYIFFSDYIKKVKALSNSQEGRLENK